MIVIASPPGLVRYGQPAGRWVLFATVLGSALAFIDATVVNIALPSVGTQSFAGWQLWMAGGQLGERK